MQKLRTPIVECPSSDVDLDSLTIETDGENNSDAPNYFIEIPKDSYVFTHILENFEYIDGLPLIHPQLIDWDQQGPPQHNTLKNNETFIDYLGTRDDFPLGDHKER